LKETGIVRRLDSLNRLVIPKGICRTMQIGAGDAVEVFVDQNRVVLQKYKAGGCTFCGSNDIKLQLHNGQTICRKCTTEIIDANIYADLETADNQG
jgi:transcriptional pleiotropic regulator of transition state genes